MSDKPAVEEMGLFMECILCGSERENYSPSEIVEMFDAIHSLVIRQPAVDALIEAAKRFRAASWQFYGDSMPMTWITLTTALAAVEALMKEIR